MRFTAYHSVISFLSLLFLVYSCSSETPEIKSHNKNGNLVITKMNDEDHAESIKTYLDKTEKSYLLLLYSPEGKLLDSATYVNDTLNGMRKFFEESTGLWHVENYHNGMLEGIDKAFYSDGIRSFEGYRKNNQKVGEWKFRYANGNPITYEFYDSTGKLKYFRKYDEEGDLMKQSGSAIIGVFPEDSTISVNAKYTVTIVAAKPFDCGTRLSITLIRQDNPDKIMFDSDVSEPSVHWKTKFSEPGEKVLRFTVRIRDLKSGKEENASVTKKVRVSAG